MSLVVFFLQELFVMRGVDFFFVFRFFDVCVAPNLYGDIISYVISFFPHLLKTHLTIGGS